MVAINWNQTSSSALPTHGAASGMAEAVAPVKVPAIICPHSADELTGANNAPEHSSLLIKVLKLLPIDHKLVLPSGHIDRT